MSNDLQQRILQLLAKHPNERIRVEVAANPNTDDKTLTMLADDENDDISENAGRNIKNPETIHKLAQTKTGKNFETLLGLASNPRASGTTLEYLSEKQIEGEYNNELLHLICTNPNTPAETLQKIFEQHRVAYLQNPNYPTKMLVELAANNDIEVRIDVAKNPTTPPDTLQALLKAADGSTDAISIYAAVGSNPEIDEQTQKMIIKTNHPHLQEGLAENQNINPKYFKQLAKNGDEGLLLCVARNPNCDHNTLNYLAQHRNLNVAQQATLHPNASKQTLQKAAKHRSPHIRAAVAANRQSPPELLAQLGQDTENTIILEIAENPNTPHQTLQHLANTHQKDGIIQVNVALNENLNQNLTALKTAALQNHTLDLYANEQVDLLLSLAQSSETTTPETVYPHLLGLAGNGTKQTDPTFEKIMLLLAEHTLQHNTQNFTAAQSLTLQKLFTARGWPTSGLIKKTVTKTPSSTIKSVSQKQKAGITIKP